MEMKRTPFKRQGIYVGVDPGSVSGGMAWIGSIVTNTIRFKDMTQKDLCCVIESLLNMGEVNVFVMIEEVHSFPKQGVVSSFKFGENFGMLKGFLMALNIPFKTVRPQVWQKYYSMKKEKNETQSTWKRRLRQRAQQLYPNIHITAETADALLIANYCMENYNG